MTASIKRQTLFTVADVVVQGVALLVMYGFLLRTVGAAELGLWSVVFSVTAIGRGVDIGLARGLTRYVPIQADQTGSAALIDAAVLGTAIVTLPVLLIAGVALAIGLPLALPTQVEGALQLVPVALVLIATLTVSNVYMTALTAVSRSDLRSMVSSASALIMLTATIILVPIVGLVGFAWALIGQQVIATVLAWLCLRGVVSNMRILPFAATFSNIRMLFGYGINLHVAGLAMLLFEPAARIILARVGPIEAVTYFDMASRMIQQVRNLVVTANQVVSPYFAKLSTGDVTDLVTLYRTSVGHTVFYATGLLSALVVMSPAIGLVWIGSPQEQFVLFTLILSAGWLANALGAPAYFVATSSGLLGPVVISHLLVSIGSSIIAFILGLLFGSVGVALGVAIGLGLGSAYCVERVHSRILNSPKHLLTAADLAFAALCFATAAAALPLYHQLRDGMAELLAASIVGGAGLLVISGGALARVLAERGRTSARASGE